jgi:hypothetical protein
MALQHFDRNGRTACAIWQQATITEIRAVRLLLLLVAGSLVPLPFLFWYSRDPVSFELSWLQIAAAVLFLAGLVLTAIEYFLPGAGRFWERPLPKGVKYLAYAGLGLAYFIAFVAGPD